MKKVIFIGLVIVFFSCKRECDCEQQNNTLFFSEEVDLPIDGEPVLTTDSSLDIHIDAYNVMSIESNIVSIIDVDSAMHVLTLANDKNSRINIYADKKSEFSAFNDVLNLSLKHNLKLIIATN